MTRRTDVQDRIVDRVTDTIGGVCCADTRVQVSCRQILDVETLVRSVIMPPQVCRHLLPSLVHTLPSASPTSHGLWPSELKDWHDNDQIRIADPVHSLTQLYEESEHVACDVSCALIPTTDRRNAVKVNPNMTRLNGRRMGRISTHV